MLVSNWKDVLKRSMVVWVSVLTALLPEVPDLALKWLASDASAQVLTPEQKNWIRTAILLVVIPFVRIWRQQSLQVPPATLSASLILKGDPPDEQ